MKAFSIGICIGLLALPAQAQTKIPDQTIGQWTEVDKASKTEHVLSVKKGVLTSESVLYDDLYPKGSKETDSVSLSRIKSASADVLTHADIANSPFSMPGDEPDKSDTPAVFRIGITALGDNDIRTSSFNGGLHHRLGDLPGFATFAPDQQSQRDEAYKKLCALIGADKCQ